MASRKEQKERLRAQRRERELAEQIQQRRKRIIALVVAAVVLVAAVVAVVVLVGESGNGGGGGGDQASGTDEVAKLLDGIPQKGNVLGDPKAKVTVKEFADLQCPACKAFADKTLPGFIEGYVRDGKAKLEYHNLLVIGPQSRDAAKGALAAAKQNRLWYYAELFFRNQGQENSGYVTEEFMQKIAKGAGVDISAWKKDKGDASFEKKIDDDIDVATKKGFSSTPSLLIVGPGGTRQASGALGLKELKKAVDGVS